MDALGSLELAWAHGYNGSKLHFIDDQVLVYGCGNILTFIDKNGDHVRSITSEGKGVGVITVSQEHGVVAYSEDSLEPLIYIIKYPESSAMHALKGDAKIKYQDLSFSSDGHKLVSLSGIPDFLLSVWNLDSGLMICQMAIEPNSVTVSVSFNPLNWKQLVLVGEDRLTLFNVECCDMESILTTESISLPECCSPVSEETHSKGRVSLNIARDKLDRKEGQVKDMTNVYYKNPYELATRKIVDVVPVSYCWTTHSSLYIGCEGGQLLMAECDAMTTRVLANPAISKDREDVTSEDEGNLPRTGHALLHEGSLQTLALSQKGLFVGGKDGHVYLFDQSNQLQLLDSCQLPHPVLSMTWSQDYTTLAVGADNGCVYQLSPGLLGEFKRTQEHMKRQFIGIDTLGMDSETFVTCREDGCVQSWDASNGSLISTLPLSIGCTAMVCPNSSSTVAVGTESGCVYTLSAVDPQSMTIVRKDKLYNTPIKTLRSDVCGRFIVVTSSSGSVFVCSAYPDKGLEVLGHTAITGNIIDLSLAPMGWDIDSTTKIGTLSCNETGACSITVMSIPNRLVDSKDIEGLCEDSMKLFNDEAISKQLIRLSEPVLSIVIAPDNSCFLVPRRSQAIFKIALPSSDEEANEVNLTALTPVMGHELVGGSYGLSFHQRWLVSLGRDGQLLLRLTDTPDRVLKCFPHHYKTGGGLNFTISPDGQKIFTTGDNRTITCWKWDSSIHGKGIVAAADFAASKIKQFKNTSSIQNTALESFPSLLTDTDQTEETTAQTKTWLENAIIEAHKAEDDKYDEQKAQLRQDISKLRDKVLAMISSNEVVADIEKLERSEFILDTEEHQRHKGQEEKRIGAVREEIELANLAKMYLKDKIKRQCWDSMQVKGKAVKGFLSRFEVSNYPLKERSKSEVEQHERIVMKRKIEIAELDTRKEVSNSYFRQAVKLSIGVEELGLEEEEETKDTGETSEPCALVGSRGGEYGAEGVEYLYEQFDLMSTVSKKHQITLLQMCIRNIKESFNKEFDELLRMKEAEIARISEKNVRINKISNDLKANETLVEPSLDPDEQPERYLQVKDDEVTVERYISEEERQRMEERAKEEEQRRLKEMADNWRERGLDLMMDGRLEANAEEDLFKDMPQPDFMSKEPSELSEEEIRLKLEFEKKKATFLEERAKLIKSLEAEMKKNQETIQQIMEAFDEKLKKLFNLKIRTEMAIQEEEMKIVRLSASLFVEDDVTMKEDELETRLNKYKQKKIAVSNILLRIRRIVEGAQEEYDIMVAEDKELDKCFKRDFADCDPFVDQLYRLFRKRPRGHKLRGGGATVGGAQVGGASVPVKTDNPFGPRPSSASLPSVTSVGVGERSEVMVMMGELDDPDNMPDGLEPSQWERFVNTRHRKVENELKVKAKALQLAEMKDFLHKRESEEENCQNEIQNVYKELASLHENKSVYDMNPEVQFLLRQGQVEINAGVSDVPDFSDSVLIHRSEIEEINSQIRTLGEAKLSNMNECKDFKKGICMLEWHIRRLHMEADDLVVKAKDVQMLRVTKELQERLMMDNIQRKDQKQIETLEKTLELNKKTHRRRLVRKRNKLGTLKTDIYDLSSENSELDVVLREEAVKVTERQQIQDIAGPLPSELNADHRMREIVGRSRLVELAKAQAKEVDVLRKEVERLRMKTFPALVQIENI